MVRKGMRTLLAGMVAAILFSCKGSNKESFQVHGTVRNADKLANPVPGGIADQGTQKNTTKVYLEEISFGKESAPVIIDSARISGPSAPFRLSGAGKEGAIISLVFGDNAVQVPLINDSKDIEVNVDLGSKEDFYTVRGSEGSSQLQELISNYAKKSARADNAFAGLDSVRRRGASDSVQSLARAEGNEALNELNGYLKKFMTETKNPTLATIALGWAAQSFSRGAFDSSLVALTQKYPDNVVLANMKKSYDAQVARQAELEKQQAANGWVGKQAPDFSMADASGKTVSLSSFRGKYVLVDFWASWCGPCRNENPNVVRAYQEYKNKNFTVLGVSLDKEKEAWLQAIRDDKLNWTQISDLKYWNSKAVDIFKFEGIPYNILVDPQGKVVAEQLRGELLESKLKELLH